MTLIGSGDDSYIDKGDRVIVTEGILESAHGRSAQPKLLGKHGIVEHNDGWGRCDVLFDDGTRATLWNVKDLERE